MFDHSANRIKVGAGNFGARSFHTRYGQDISDNQALAATFSHRRTDNSWRDHNSFDTTQLSLKHGLFFGRDNVWETELSYNESNLQFPGSMDEAQFHEYVDTGRQTDNDSAFKNTGRYSKTWFFNTRMELPYQSFTLKPRFYYNSYSQFHPVTGTIVDTPGTHIFGLDVELEKTHRLIGKAATFTAGVTSRRDIDNDSKRYAYRDIVTIPGGPQAGRIIETLSDEKGALIEIQDNTNSLQGFFLQESVRLSRKNLLDIGARADWSRMDISGNEIQRYDYATGQYVTGDGEYSLKRDFFLWSPRIGLTHVLTPETSLFVSLAQADQVPFANELDKNPDLDKSRVRNFEIGLKRRSVSWTADASVYYARGLDEIVSSLQDGETLFQNAGETEKKGLELATTFRPARTFSLGANYAYSDYRYRSFTEVVSGVSYDRSGNQLPFIPRHKLTLFADVKHPSGVTARISTDSWGKYYVDNANSETWDGYQFVTNLFVGYETGRHRWGLDNLTDQRYAIEVTKDRATHFTAGAPRSFLLSYQYNL